MEEIFRYFSIQDFIVAFPQIVLLGFFYWLQYCVRKSRELYGENVIKLKIFWKKK